MANTGARGNTNKGKKGKSQDARTAGGAKRDISTQAGSGNRGGHRRRKGGRPEG